MRIKGTKFTSVKIFRVPEEYFQAIHVKYGKAKLAVLAIHSDFEVVYLAISYVFEIVSAHMTLINS